MAQTKITPELIKQMNELYLKIKTYAGVSRELGGSPSPTTVKKYIIPNYISEEVIKESRRIFTVDEIPEFSADIFQVENWGNLCVLSDDEKAEIKELWNEMVI